MAKDKKRSQYLNYYNGLLGKLKLFSSWLNAHKWAYFILLSVPVILFNYQYFATGNKVIVGDHDYYTQLYEAFRITLLDYGQFPSWNPWMAGGLPLYANPQFGLFSIQSVLVLLFGSIYGLKLAYIVYAIAGFWGMYTVGKKVIGASALRSALVAYIWVFSGFFAGHAISHFTFALFFLLPWLIYFIYKRKEKWSWLWFALIESIIILSSIHYAFLMTTLAVAIYFALTLMQVKVRKKVLNFELSIDIKDVSFALKAGLIIILLTAHRVITTLSYMTENARDITSPEIYPTIGVVLSALFLPTGVYFSPPGGLQWTWGEYSMYIGIGATLAFIVISVLMIKTLFKKKTVSIRNWRFVLPIVIIGIIGLVLAFGDFGRFSPYNLLHELPGFTQTRVPSRWLLFTTFAFLVIILCWKKNNKLINVLLTVGVIELFLVFGPPTAIGQNQFSLPPYNKAYPEVMTQYDNGKNHLDMQQNVEHSYVYATVRNIGQIYADDSVVNTLNEHYGTSKCGLNKNKKCLLVLSGNAEVTKWTPNTLSLKRTGDGPIILNINVQAGWRVNGKYIYMDNGRLDPMIEFAIPDDSADTYELVYAPRPSPSWISWRLAN